MDNKLPTDAAARKAVPIYSGFVKYFPRAMAAVAQLSRVGNEQHNPGKPLHWDRSKSGDELDAATRHLLEAGTVDTDGERHSTKLAWRAMANLEKELEQEEQKANRVIPGGIQFTVQLAGNVEVPDTIPAPAPCGICDRPDCEGGKH